MGELPTQNPVITQVFEEYDVMKTGQLSAQQLQGIHSDMRLGGLSIPQVILYIIYIWMF